MRCLRFSYVCDNLSRADALCCSVDGWSTGKWGTQTLTRQVLPGRAPNIPPRAPGCPPAIALPFPSLPHVPHHCEHMPWQMRRIDSYRLRWSNVCVSTLARSCLGRPRPAGRREAGEVNVLISAGKGDGGLRWNYL